MKEELYRFDDDDIDSIAYSVAFSEWLGIDNLQDCALTRISEEDRGKYERKLEEFRHFFQYASGEEYFSHFLLQNKMHH
ncbi:hypothetical protein UXP06_15800 [Enterobacter ludwigii]|uniref:hypothetical protein n=1 Tax=Enterobacter ludwigii TaxID=299767 RepID=UPI002FCED22B